MPRALLILALAVFLGGCTAYRKPAVKVTDVQVGDRSESGIVLKIVLDAENQNDVELPLREIRYQVRMQGGATFSGLRSAEASLRRLGTQRITFPAVIPLAAGEPAPSGPVLVEVSGKLGYLAPGQIAQVLYDTGIQRPARAFSGSQTVDLGAAK